MVRSNRKRAVLLTYYPKTQRSMVMTSAERAYLTGGAPSVRAHVRHCLTQTRVARRIPDVRAGWLSRAIIFMELLHRVQRCA